jgi:hypothetical protein
MRFASAILIGLSAVGLTPCLADPPNSTAAPASQPAPPATSASSTPASAPAEAAPAAKAASSQASPATQAAPTLDADEKQLMNAGYTPEMHNGTKLWCKRENEIGSRLGSRQKTCGTAEQLMLAQQRAQEQFRQPQAASNVPASSGK